MKKIANKLQLAALWLLILMTGCQNTSQFTVKGVVSGADG